MPDLDTLLWEYVTAPTWNDAFVILRDNGALLLTPTAESFLQQKLDAFEAGGDIREGLASIHAGRMDARLSVLRAARAYGLDEAWKRVGPFMRPWMQEKKDNPDWIPYWKTR